MKGLFSVGLEALFFSLFFFTAILAPAQVTLNYTKAVMKVGETLQLTASTSSGPATDIVWGSYEDDIASVSATGLVTARKVGETLVYAMLNDGSYLGGECLVQVVKDGENPTDEVLVRQITFPGVPSQLAVGQSYRLQAAVQPENATNKALRWSLTGSAAYITGDVLFATAEGKVTVTAEATDGSRTKGTFSLQIVKTDDGQQTTGSLLHGTVTSATDPRQITFDLGERHVISQVGYRASDGAGSVQLGVFEGANLSDFTDALPLYIIPHQPSSTELQLSPVTTTRGFRYVRFKGPEGSHPSPADVTFYGTPGEGDDSHIAQLTNLPTIVINTLKEAEPVDNVTNITSYISLISKEGAKVLTDTAKIRLRGNSSKAFPKKPYRIKWDEKHHVLGSPAKDKKWVLINNYSDKSLIRNMVGFEVSRCMGMAYTPFCTMADVIVNGDYRGTYQLADKIEVGKDRLDIPKHDPLVSTSPADGSYLVETDMCGNTEPSAFSTRYIQPDGYEQEIPFTVQYPEDDERTDEQYAYVKDEIAAMTQAGFTHKDLQKHIDIPSFLRYFLIEEFCGNTDAYWSALMYKVPGDTKWYYGPVWDFDIAFDNAIRVHPTNDKSSFIYLNYGSASGMKYMVDAVLKALEPQYREGGPKGTRIPQMMADIWAQARYEGGLTEEHLMAFVDSLAEEIIHSQDLNFKRWPILTTQVQMEPMVCLYPTFHEHIDLLKRYLRDRLEWMDEQLGYEGTPTYITPIVINENESTRRKLPLEQLWRYICPAIYKN